MILKIITDAFRGAFGGPKPPGYTPMASAPLSSSANKFMILMPGDHHLRGPFDSEDAAFEWLRQVGWSRSRVEVLQVTDPNCSTSA